MVISLDLRRSRRRLRDGSRPSASASNLLAAVSEIAAGRIALFTPRPESRYWSLLLSRSQRSVPIWTVDATHCAALVFTRHPRSMQPGLSSDPYGRISDHRPYFQ